MQILGIDLGTTNSAVALVRAQGKPEMLPNRDGGYVTPSVVFFDGDQPVVGSAAKHSAILAPDSVAQLVKRQMGNPDWRFISESGREYRAEEISAIILRRLKDDAEAFCGKPFERAVITVPAYFQDAQRKATMDAGEMAGFIDVRIINEPTAAALAYGIGTEREERILVYDLGGGTFDVTVMNLAPKEIVVLASLGIRELGGTDWDNEIVTWLNEQFMAAGGPDLLADPQTLQDLRDRAEAAKVALSQMSQTKVALSASGCHQSIALTRDTFEDLTRSLLNQTKGVLDEAIEDSGLHWPELDKVLLVGGSTRMPAVARVVEEVTGKKPSRELHPDEVVALGAALRAAQFAAEHSASEAKGVSDGPSGIAETHATGIAEVTVTDVTAHSLGYVLLDDSGGLFNEVVVDRGTRLPCSVERVIYTSIEGQTKWNCQVNQGEERDLTYVTKVGEGIINFDGPKPRRHPLRTLFSYDDNGLVHIQAYDGVSGVFWGEVMISRTSNLGAADVAAGRSRVDNLAIG
jgi:molecular chaperone DnaK